MGALLNIARNAGPREAERVAPPTCGSAQQRELRRLIEIVLADSPHEHAEALAAAVADPSNALMCFRDLATQLESPATKAIEATKDTRRTCGECGNLSPERQCLAALRGQPLGFAAPRTYRPITTIPGHCQAFCEASHG
jgi:hypothetical protein